MRQILLKLKQMLKLLKPVRLVVAVRPSWMPKPPVTLLSKKVTSKPRVHKMLTPKHRLSSTQNSKRVCRPT